jgi:outer membrane usher protein
MIEAQGPYGRYEASQEVIDGQSNTRASAAGGLVFIGGGVHPTRPVNQSYALVRVPEVGGVRAYLNNQEIGRTNRRGDTLIPNLLPYYANRIAISDQDVPLDRDIETVEQSVAPPYHGGALVVFQASRRQAITGTLVVTVGSQTVIPALGELTVIVGSQSLSSPIGSNGEFYLENIPAGRYEAIVVFSGGRCRLTLEVPTSTAPVIRLGVVRCGSPEGE